ncbi:MAG: cytidylate kinase family protein [Candidatus Curtissbacteria bacterium]|nr:cytidylate kinase family protein [Candidatus Curtissbacteria bacterium]
MADDKWKIMYKSIVLSGPVASGTSTAAKSLAEKFNLELHIAGDFFRKYIQDHNIPLPNKEEIPDEIEKQVDEDLTNLLKDASGVVVDALYAGYFTHEIPHVLKVLLICDEEERIKRALRRHHTHLETAEDVIKRDRAHDKKFRKLYADENFLDPKFFDLVIDTTKTQPEDVVEKISEKFGENNPVIASTFDDSV